MFKKFRRAIAGTTSAAVVAGMVVTGVVATATPALADFVIQGPQGPYTTSKNNPTLPKQCGLDFGLVLDSSGSIGDDPGMENLKLASDAFVDALVDTNSKVAMTSFSTVSPGLNSNNNVPPAANLAPINLTSANKAAVKASYANLRSSGRTNWQDGLLKMQQFFPQFSGGAPDLVIMITDGNPNTINNPNGSGTVNYNDGDNAAVNPAIVIANDMKTANVKMFGIAVGSTIDLDPIKAITNTTAYNAGPPSNFPTAGYVQTNNYAALAAQLKEIAVDLCAPSLTITKLADTPDTQGFQPSNGWTFDTTVTIPGANGKWVTPTTDTITQNVPITRSAATAQGGAVTFQWEPDGNFPTNPVVVKETLQGGYERNSLLECVARNVLAGTSRIINVNVDANGNWTLGQIEPREIVTCTAKNTLTKLKLVKTVSGGGTVPADWTMTATSPNAPSYSKPGNHNAFEPINGGVVYTLGETPPANAGGAVYTPGTWTCTGLTVQNGNQVTVPKGTQTECSITNTRTANKLTLQKQWGANAVTGDKADLKIVGGITDPAENTSTAPAAPVAGNSAVTQVRSGAPVTVSELLPGANTGNYSSSLQCTGGVTPNGQGQFTMPNTEVVCTYTNTRTANKLTLQKQWGANAVTGDKADLKIVGGITDPAENTSTAPAAPVAGNSAVTQVRSGAPVTVSELLPGANTGNYSSSLQCTGGVTPNGQGQFTMPNTEVVCTYTNTRTANKLTLQKQWGANAVTGDKADLKIVGGITDPAENTSTAPAAPVAGNSAVTQVRSGAPVTVSELLPGANTGNYSSSLQCTGGVTPNGQGQFTMPNTEVVCTYTNTRTANKLTLQKQWGANAVTGDKADLKIVGGITDPAENTSTAPAAPVAGNSAVTQVRSGAPVTVSELLPGANTGNYSSSLQCTGGVTPNGQGQFTMPNTEVVCTYTNTRTANKLTLQKQWGANAVTGDKADLKIVGGITDPAENTSTAPAAPVAGNSAVTQVRSGAPVTVSELLPGANTGNYSSSLQCTGGVTPNGQGQFTMPNTEVVCTYTNTRTANKLTLQKQWGANAVTGDKADLKIVGGITDPAENTSTAPAAPVAGNSAVTQVRSGAPVTVSELLPGANTGNYSSSLQCTGGVTPNGQGQFTMPNTEVVCTYTNTRTANKLTLQKQWGANAVTGDKADLKIVGGITDPAENTSTAPAAPVAGNSAVTQVRSGAPVTVSELLPGANTGNYSSSLQCTGGVTPNGQGQFTMPNTEVVCTYTNTRTANKLTLVKEWVNSKAGDKAELEIVGGITVPTTGTAFAPAGVTIETDAFSGASVAVTEQVSGSGYYDKELVCTVNGQPFPEGNDGSFQMPNKPVTCTYINTRTTLKLVKQVQGQGDPDDWTLTATGPEGAPKVENLGGQGVPTNVKPGVEYNLEEVGPVGYTPGTWVCQSAGDSEGTVTAADLQRALNDGTGAYTLEKGSNIVCTIINTRDLGSLTIIKSFNPKSSGYDKAFNISYQCTDEAKQTVSVKAGESKTITGIPTGSECIVSEVKPTDPPAGWSFSEPVYDPADGKVTVTRKDQDVSVTVTNEILKPGINIVKTASATQVNPGETVTYTYTVTNPGDAELTDVKVSDDKCAPVTYQSGDTNADSKLQTSETWIYTCSQPITLATTNIGTATAKDKNGLEVSGQDSFTVAVVSPVVVKQICPIEPKLTTPKVKKVGNRVLVKKITTKKSSCVLLKPVVLCRPVASAAAGQTAFCRTTVTRKGFIKVNTKGYDKVRVTVLVRSKPKPDFTDRWKPSTWRKTWLLK